LNSPKDDFSIYYTEAGKSGYLASNRYGGKGMDDIYRFVASPPTDMILAVVTKEKLDNNTLAILQGVDIAIKNKRTDEIQKMPVNSKGQLFTKVDCGTSYEITGTKDGYFTQLKNITANCVTRHDTVFVELTFDKIIIDKPIVIKNIYYDFDKWNIRKDAAVELDKIVVILLQNPGIEIELGSHTDCRGSDEYNQVLSQHRAESAVAYIVSMGIDKKRITAKGYGESVLVNRCSNGVECTEEEHQMNRRTEFKVTKMILKGQNTELKSIP
jgi:peptidoglycan-associated lipoprotein